MMWLGLVLAFAAGVVTGLYWHRFVLNSDSRARSLAEQLQALEAEVAGYRDNVHQHFTKTAQLSNNLTHAWRELHEQLTGGARQLCPDDPRVGGHNPARDFQPLDGVRHIPGLAQISHALGSHIEPPRDYADKADPEEGTLAEGFGLKQRR